MPRWYPGQFVGSWDSGYLAALELGGIPDFLTSARTGDKVNCVGGRHGEIGSLFSPVGQSMVGS